MKVLYCIGCFILPPKSDCNISMIVSQTTVKLCSKIEIISSSQSKFTSTKQYDRRCQKLRSTYKIRSVFFLALVSIFLKFSVVFLIEDGQTESEVNELTTTYA